MILQTTAYHLTHFNLGSFMKKTLISAITLLVSSLSLANNVCQQNYGQTVCGSGVVKNVSSNGTATLNKTVVTGKASINGSLHAQSAKIAYLSVNGTATIKDSIISKSAIINGTIHASQSTFLSDLIIASNTSTLNQSVTKNIYINKSSNNSNQEIFLNDHSIIDGDINFKSGGGIVYLSHGSKINGTVIGGKVIKK